jgi:hypothetical protein
VSGKQEYGACIITIMNVPFVNTRALSILISSCNILHGNNVTILIYLFVKM